MLLAFIPICSWDFSCRIYLKSEIKLQNIWLNSLWSKQPQPLHLIKSYLTSYCPVIRINQVIRWHRHLKVDMSFSQLAFTTNRHFSGEDSLLCFSFLKTNLHLRRIKRQRVNRSFGACSTAAVPNMFTNAESWAPRTEAVATFSKSHIIECFFNMVAVSKHLGVALKTGPVPGVGSGRKKKKDISS